MVAVAISCPVQLVNLLFHQPFCLRLLIKVDSKVDYFVEHEHSDHDEEKASELPKGKIFVTIALVGQKEHPNGDYAALLEDDSVCGGRNLNEHRREDFVRPIREPEADAQRQ